MWLYYDTNTVRTCVAQNCCLTVGLSCGCAFLNFLQNAPTVCDAREPRHPSGTRFYMQEFCGVLLKGLLSEEN